jgi:hypothetical protein
VDVVVSPVVDEIVALAVSLLVLPPVVVVPEVVPVEELVVLDVSPLDVLVEVEVASVVTVVPPPVVPPEVWPGPWVEELVPPVLVLVVVAPVVTVVPPVVTPVVPLGAGTQKLFEQTLPVPQMSPHRTGVPQRSSLTPQVTPGIQGLLGWHTGKAVHRPLLQNLPKPQLNPQRTH